MKSIVKIQSFSDVITNSSSTVFLMHEQDAKYWEKTVPFDCCSIQQIDLQWILDNDWEWELIFDYLNIDKNTISEKHEGSWSSYWRCPDTDIWRMWVDDNKEMLEEKVCGLYYVDIEDHFEDAYDVIDSASGDALISENRH